MGFVWTKFGVMAPPMEDHRYVYAMNTAGESRKLSKFKYPNHQELKQKCTSLIGLPTVIRTSQNTANWSASEWFSDISLDDEHTGELARSGSDQITESHADLMLKINQIGQQMENISSRFEQHIEHQTSVSEARDQQLRDETINRYKQEIATLNAQLANATSQLERAEAIEARKKAEAREKRANEQTDEAIQRAQNANKRVETLRLENEQLKDERDSLKEALQGERALLPSREQRNIQELNRKLLESIDKIVGHQHSIQCIGHPRRTLALRAGVLAAQGRRLKLEVVEHVDGNCFIAKLLEHQDNEVVVALGLDNRAGLFAYTFKSTDPIWFEVEEQITGLSEAILKHTEDITDEELIAHHQSVKAELYRRKSEGF